MRRQPATDDRHQPSRRDRGVTFVELVVTIVLLGTVVLGILAATRASIRSSTVSSEAARVESALLTAADRVERASRDDSTFRCDITGPVHAAAQLELGVTDGEAPNYASVRYEHLTSTGWADGACPGAAGDGPGGSFEPNLVQRITITMASPRSDLQRELTVLKGDARGTP